MKLFIIQFNKSVTFLVAEKERLARERVLQDPLENVSVLRKLLEEKDMEAAMLRKQVCALSVCIDRWHVGLRSYVHACMRVCVRACVRA